LGITFVGDDNDNYIVGSAGNDRIYGMGGDDTLIGLGGDDVIDGGAGSDTVDYSGSGAAVIVNLNLGTATGAAIGSDTLISIENVIGSAFADTLTGSDAANRIEGGAGNDTLTGLNGDDVYVFGDNAGNDTIIEQPNGGNDTFDYSLSTINHAFTIDATLSALAENIIGGAGDDTFTFVDGVVLAGYIDGKGSANILNFANLQSPISVSLTSLGDVDGFNGTVSMLGGGFKNTTQLIGSGANGDTLIGSNLMTTWKLEVGSLKLEVGSNALAFSNFETLMGGNGGNTFNLSGTRTFNLIGGTGNDTFGFADNARLIGNIDGFGGHDTLDFSAYTTARRILLTGYDSEDGFIGTDTSPSSALIGLFRHINEIIGSSDPNDPDLLIGLNNNATWDVGGTNQYHVNPTLDFSSFETLNGGSGQDTFDVDGNQNITLVGGAGNDSFILYSGAQVTSLNGQGGSDTLEYYDYTGPIDINTGNGTATNVPGGISSVEVVMRAFRPSVVIVPAVVGAPEEVTTAGSLSGDVVPLIQTAATFIVVNHRAAANAPTNWVLFTAASGDSASVILEPVTSLPYFMPTGYTFVSALKVAVMLNGQVMTTLPSGKTLTLSFAIPTSFAARNLAILYWDTTLNNGAGGWVKLNIVIRQREQVTGATGWTILPMKLFYWNDAAKFGTGDWAEVEVNALYNADGWIELPATIGSSVLTLTNAERRALTTVNFTGVFVLVVE
ncbi:MAG: hypothetical protein HZB77_10120, partial [Chloroflexi bacterium]|nr:hypothetical protein [Chloroflexota bacterium]